MMALQGPLRFGRGWRVAPGEEIAERKNMRRDEDIAPFKVVHGSNQPQKIIPCLRIELMPARTHMQGAAVFGPGGGIELLYV